VRKGRSSPPHELPPILDGHTHPVVDVLHHLGRLCSSRHPEHRYAVFPDDSLPSLPLLSEFPGPSRLIFEICGSWRSILRTLRPLEPSKPPHEAAWGAGGPRPDLIFWGFPVSITPPPSQPSPRSWSPRRVQNGPLFKHVSLNSRCEESKAGRGPPGELPTTVVSSGGPPPRRGGRRSPLPPRWVGEAALTAVHGLQGLDGSLGDASPSTPCSSRLLRSSARRPRPPREPSGTSGGRLKSVLKSASLLQERERLSQRRRRTPRAPR